MKMLNLGCGDQFHTSWTNIDFKASVPGIIEHNLLKGIPMGDNQADVIYHSHVLEHFSAADGKKLLTECFRVLKPGGILRVAVPDLENITREYLSNLESARNGSPEGDARYEWIKLELLDQMVRHSGGGQCSTYFYRENMPAENYVHERWGETARILRRYYHNSVKSGKPGIMERIRWKLKRPFAMFESETKRIGRYRTSGEVHLWMYDSYSLGKLMKECGFISPVVVDAFSSSIPDWKKFELEEKGGVLYKPDTLVMEAVKAK